MSISSSDTLTSTRETAYRRLESFFRVLFSSGRLTFQTASDAVMLDLRQCHLLKQAENHAMCPTKPKRSTRTLRHPRRISLSILPSSRNHRADMLKERRIPSDPQDEEPFVHLGGMVQHGAQKRQSMTSRPPGAFFWLGYVLAIGLVYREGIFGDARRVLTTGSSTNVSRFYGIVYESSAMIDRLFHQYA